MEKPLLVAIPLYHCYMAKGIEEGVCVGGQYNVALESVMSLMFSPMAPAVSNNGCNHLQEFHTFPRETEQIKSADGQQTGRTLPFCLLTRTAHFVHSSLSGP